MKRSMLLAAMLFTGCASGPGDVASAAGTWIGASYDEVVSRWGTPVRSSALAEGREAYTWVSESTTSRGMVFPSIGIFGGTGGVGIGAGASVGPGGVALVRCERTLIFQNRQVVDHTWQGDAAYCDSFRRG
jgi:hypothetical protein